MEINTKTVAVRVDNKIKIVTSTACSKGYCKEYGCAFPDCAIYGDTFKDESAARDKYPDLEIVA